MIASLPEYSFTALKVSSHRHADDLSKDYDIIEETDRGGGNDTSRFLKAGAARAFWIRAERIEAALPAVLAIIDDSSSAVIEGNGVLDFIDADFSILVLNPAVAEFKESARGVLARADALVFIKGTSKNAAMPEWENLLELVPKNTPRFETGDPKIFPPALTELLRFRFYGKKL